VCVCYKSLNDPSNKLPVSRPQMAKALRSGLGMRGGWFLMPETHRCHFIPWLCGWAKMGHINTNQIATSWNCSYINSSVYGFLLLAYCVNTNIFLASVNNFRLLVCDWFNKTAWTLMLIGVSGHQKKTWFLLCSSCPQASLVTQSLIPESIHRLERCNKNVSASVMPRASTF
jgi:hypothetical protein